MDVKRMEPAVRRPTGWTVFAGTLLLLAGAFNVIWGLEALLNSRVVTASGAGLVFLSFRVWGWGYAIIGGIMIVTAIALFMMQPWARWAAIGFVGLNAIINIVYFPAYPLWSFLMIVLDVVIIYQLATSWTVEAAARGQKPPAAPQQPS